MIKSIRKKIYIKHLSEKMRTEWTHLNNKTVSTDAYDVSCTECPKFSRLFSRCTVPFGSKLRSCICASTEFHMQDSKNKKVLEIGCGESSFLRSCVESIGGEWIGIDPRAGKNRNKSARSIGAQVAYLPFEKNSFDVVAGTQTIEHWEDPLTPIKDCSYQRAMKEIWRVLKPGGLIYLDAPMYMHGAPEFILGDIEAIKKVFAYDPWDSLKYFTWRKECSPLKPSFPIKRQTERWPAILGKKYSPSLESEQIYLIAFSAKKPLKQFEIPDSFPSDLKTVKE